MRMLGVWKLLGVPLMGEKQGMGAVRIAHRDATLGVAAVDRLR